MKLMERVKATLRVKRYTSVLKKTIATGFTFSFISTVGGILTL